MLKKLSVKNLGCFDDQTYEIDFSKETLIVGPNNSGKSMFLTGCNLVRHYAVLGSKSWTTESYDLTNFESVVYAHEKERKIEISMTITEGTNEFTYEMGLRDGNWSLMINKSSFGRTPKDIERMKGIWFFRPNRSLVPYSASVQPTAGPLQPLRPSGSNVINYLLERWTSRDKRWDIAESWLKKIDPDMTEMRTPIKGNQASFETMFGNLPVNVSLQGSGFQSAAAVIAAIVFSPKDSTIIIEEPEVFLHSDSQEVIVDMINDAVNNHEKQVIFSTHSWNMLLPLFKDIGTEGSRRTTDHTRAIPSNFGMYTFKKVSKQVSIEPYPLQQKTFQQFRDDFKIILG